MGRKNAAALALGQTRQDPNHLNRTQIPSNRLTLITSTHYLPMGQHYHWNPVIMAVALITATSNALLGPTLVISIVMIFALYEFSVRYLRLNPHLKMVSRSPTNALPSII